MPVRLARGKKKMWIYPTAEFQETRVKRIMGLDREFYYLHN
jgi:hypothetical protein